MPLMRGGEPKDWRTAFYYQYYEYPRPHHVMPHYGIITDRYKLVQFYGTKNNYTELFDLKNDPRELLSVYNNTTYSTIQKSLSQELINLRKELKVPDKTTSSAFGKEDLDD